MSIRIVTVVALTALVLLSAHAAPAQGPTVQCGVTATPLTFGSYSVFNSSGVDSTAEVRLTCSLAQRVKILVDQGVAGTYLDRVMTRLGGGEHLHYQVFTDATRQVPWGNGTSGTQPVIGLVSSRRAVFTVYAHAPGSQMVPAGTYADQLSVTISF